MSAVAQPIEAEVLESVRADYERRGLRFLVDPPREAVPAFLGPMRPDAIALGDQGGVVIEVKRRSRRAAEPQLAALARLVGQQAGWTLDVIYAPERPEDLMRLTPASEEQIAAQLDEAETLLRGGHGRAALLLGWAALEARLRALIAADERSARRVHGAAELVERLAMDGWLDPEEARRLRALAPTRNAVAHGDLAAAPEPAEVAWLLRLGRRLGLAAADA